MKAFKTLMAAGLLMGLAIGCSTTKSKEDMLSAAGFKRLPANTPERQANLASLPADKLTPVQREGKQYYVFPDPKQNALYVGDDAQYQEYRKMRFQKQMEDEQLATSMNYDSAWGWGAWGGPGWAWR